MSSVCWSHIALSKMFIIVITTLIYISHCIASSTVCVIHIISIYARQIMLFYRMIIVCTSYCVGIGICGFPLSILNNNSQKQQKCWNFSNGVLCVLLIVFHVIYIWFYSRVNRIKLNRKHTFFSSYFLNKFPHSNV